MNRTAFFDMSLMFGLLLALIALIVIFLLAMQNTLKAVEPANRTMQPNKVWYLFIPIFNIYWVFKVISAIADSAKMQLEVYGVYKEGRPTYYLGIAWAVSFLLARIPLIQTLFSFVSLILWIIYWVKLVQLKKELLSYGEIYHLGKEDSVL